MAFKGANKKAIVEQSYTDDNKRDVLTAGNLQITFGNFWLYTFNISENVTNNTNWL